MFFEKFIMTSIFSMNTQHKTQQNENVFLSALLLIAVGLLSFAPLLILGSAIGWPASLGSPAVQQLAAIARAPQAVAAGYGVYLLYSVLILPVMVVVARIAFGGLANAGAVVVVGFAALSALSRSIGILRWLTVMPQLAQQHALGNANERGNIELVFQAVNSWGGGIGELLGVSLFMGLSLGTAMVAAWQSRSMPRLLVMLGLVTTLLLLGLFLPAVGLSVKVSVAAAVSALSLWMLATGAWWLKKRTT